MARRCRTCAEPHDPAAGFCGRCGARVGGRREPAAAARRRRAPSRLRPTPRRIVAALAVAGLAGVLAAGLEMDPPPGEVAVPSNAPPPAEAGPAAAASPAPPPPLRPCDDDASELPCVRWQRPRSGATTALGDAETVYVVAPDGAVTALDRATGQARWTAGAGAGDLVDVQAHGDLLRFVEADAVRAVDAGTGETAWTWTSPEPGVHLVPGSGEAPIVSGDGALTALDPTTGRERWRLEVPGLRGTARDGRSGHLVALDGDGGMVGIDATTGAVRWRARLAFGARSTVHVHGSDGAVLAIIDPPPADDGSRTPRVVGIDPSSGAVRWVHLYRSAVERGGVVLTDDLALLVGTASAGTVAAVDLGSGGVSWQREFGSEPAHADLVDDQLVVASGRRLVLLAADGSIGASVRVAAPVVRVAASAPGTAVIETEDGILALELPTDYRGISS